MIEVLSVDIALMCFKSNFLERKVQGLKGLCDIIRNVKLQRYKHVTQKALVRINNKDISQINILSYFS